MVPDTADSVALVVGKYRFNWQIQETFNRGDEIQATFTRSEPAGYLYLMSETAGPPVTLVNVLKTPI